MRKSQVFEPFKELRVHVYIDLSNVRAINPQKDVENALHSPHNILAISPLEYNAAYVEMDDI